MNIITSLHDSEGKFWGPNSLCNKDLRETNLGQLYLCLDTLLRQSHDPTPVDIELL